jgi:hypothetical protein
VHDSSLYARSLQRWTVAVCHFLRGKFGCVQRQAGSHKKRKGVAAKGRKVSQICHRTLEKTCKSLDNMQIVQQSRAFDVMTQLLIE